MCPFCGSAVSLEAARIRPGKHRSLQAVRTGARKLFGKQRKEAFLQWFALTADVGFAASQAGVCRQTVSKHRLSDPAFDEAARAEPVAARFETGRAKLAGRFPELEDEMAGLIAGGGYEGPGKSPDRADAMVWAMNALARPGREPRVRVL